MPRLEHQNSHYEEESISRINCILSGVLMAYAISLVVFLVTALLLSIANISEVIVPHLTYVTSVLSIIVGAIYTSRIFGQQGWLNGGLCGILYFLGLLILSIVIGVELAGSGVILSRGALAFIFGAVGGVIGINV